MVFTIKSWHDFPSCFASKWIPGVFAGHKLNVKNPMDGSTFVITVPQSAAPGRQVLSKMFGIANDEYRHRQRRSNLFSALWLWIWWRFNEEYSEICKRGIQVFNLIDTYWKKCSTIILYNICTSNVQSPAHCQDHCWRYHHPRRVRNPARRECLCKAPSNSRLQMPVFWLPAVHVSCNSCKFVAGKITNNICFSNYCKETRMKQLQLFLQFASFRSKVRHRSSFWASPFLREFQLDRR